VDCASVRNDKEKMKRMQGAGQPFKTQEMVSAQPAKAQVAIKYIALTTDRKTHGHGSTRPQRTPEALRSGMPTLTQLIESRCTRRARVFGNHLAAL
jgi:hypothetical protein